MEKQIKIGRETKIRLLKALKNGYFEWSDIMELVKSAYGELTDEELDSRIKELDRKLGLGQTVEVEIIDRREQVYRAE